MDILIEHWFLLEQPFTPSDLAGYTVLAGSSDPHIGVVVCDLQPIEWVNDDDVTAGEARAIATHIVDLHNSWIEHQKLKASRLIAEAAGQIPQKTFRREQQKHKPMSIEQIHKWVQGITNYFFGDRSKPDTDGNTIKPSKPWRRS